jgi:hypothetical protein
MMLTADLPDAHFASDTPSVADHTLKTGTFTLRTLPVEIGELNETMSLASKRRLHNSEDGSELMFETVNTIPFGAEPEIRRKIRISEGLICCAMDMVMRASCPLTTLSAGGIVISGGFRKIGLILPPQKGSEPAMQESRDWPEIKEDEVLFDAPYPPLGLTLTAEKERLDWMIGDDLWRWTNAERIGGGKARFVITKKEQGLRMEWKLFEKTPVRSDEDEPVPGRNWRLTWAAAWTALPLPRKKRAARVFDLGAFDWPENARAAASLKKNKTLQPGCFCSMAVQNTLKKWIRSNWDEAKDGMVFELKNVQPRYCVNASHVDRPKFKSLPHWDMMSILEFRRWAGRLLAKKNAQLRLRTPEKSPWRGFMTLD